MKVLFVSRSKKLKEVSPIIFNQGESLRACGVDVHYFTVDKKGLTGYLSALIPLGVKLRKENYDVVHAHFSLTGFLVTIAAPLKQKIIVSLMGSFKSGSMKYYLINQLAKYRWKEVIVKSEKMKSQIGIQKAHILSNGVAIEKFIPKLHSRENIRKELGFAQDQKVVLFVSDPARLKKNFKLCKDSVEQLNDKAIVLITVFDKPHDEVVKNMIAADVLMHTSLAEGSPNVIKEAMAANCPIVVTDVGDVRYLLSNLPGTYVMDTFTVEEGAQKLKTALEFKGRTPGIERLKKLGLTSENIALKIKKLYMS